MVHNGEKRNKAETVKDMRIDGQLVKRHQEMKTLEDVGW